MADLTEVLKALKVYRWKLNPTKCIFGIPSGILLGNIVSHHGIEANLEKIAVVTNMKPLTCVKGRPEANGVHGGFKSFHISSGRKGTPLLQATQGSREICLVRGR